MSREEYLKIRGLEKCRFLPGSFAKNFVRTLATFEETDRLTDRQVAYLDKVYYTYREQINVLREMGLDLPIPLDPSEEEISYNDDETD